MNPVLILRGPAGVGKSTIARHLQRLLGEQWVTIDVDQLKYPIPLKSQDTNRAERAGIAHDVSYEFVRKLLEHGYCVILEEMYKQPKFEQLTSNLRMQAIPWLSVFLSAPKHVVVERSQNRDKLKPVVEIERHYDETQPLPEDFVIDVTAHTPEDAAALIAEHLGQHKGKFDRPAAASTGVRIAQTSDLPSVAQMLFDFNTEYDDVTPPPAELAQRLGELTATGDTDVLISGADPDGLVLLRFWPAIWTRGLECYLAEFYVRPDRRGQGIGRPLLEAAIAHARERGADYIMLGTSDDDAAARHLYEACGFTNREGGPDGPIMYVYEREL